MSAIEVLSVAAEAFPLVKTGGLADVVGALPAALAPHDVRVRTLLPGYPAVRDRLHEVREVARLPHGIGGPATLLEATAGDLDLLVLDAPQLYTRAGGPNSDAARRDWPDNLARFAALSRVAADIGHGLLPSWRPDVVHAHDWQAGLTPAYLAFG
ncbi:MAG: glycogen/starch synthase, partial [Gemmatimonadota bacterium]